VISRVAGIASALLAVLSVVCAWGITASPDSDLKVGLIVALPFMGFAVALGLVAFWTRPGHE
jgi:hypothetical protein